jgi:hypothetical protein
MLTMFTLSSVQIVNLAILLRMHTLSKSQNLPIPTCRQSLHYFQAFPLHNFPMFICALHAFASSIVSSTSSCGILASLGDFRQNSTDWALYLLTDGFYVLETECADGAELYTVVEKGAGFGNGYAGRVKLILIEGAVEDRLLADWSGREGAYVAGKTVSCVSVKGEAGITGVVAGAITLPLSLPADYNLKFALP